jgi:PST family polysaccharide transporter
MFRAVMIDSAISAASIVVALPFGAIAVAGSFAVTGLLLRVPVGFWLAARRGPVLLRDIYVSLLPSALTAVSVGGFVWLLRPLLERMDLSVLASLALSAAAGIVVAALTFCAIPQSRRTMRNIGQFAQFLRGREPKVQT